MSASAGPASCVWPMLTPCASALPRLRNRMDSSGLSAMADGEATPADVKAVRPHLRNCAACRATMRAFHHGAILHNVKSGAEGTTQDGKSLSAL